MTELSWPEETYHPIEEDRILFDRVCLVREVIGPSGEALGTYLSAFTHLSLITTCIRLNQFLDTNRGRCRSHYIRRKEQ